MDARRAEEDAPIGLEQTDEHLVVSPTGVRKAGVAMLCALLVAVTGMVWLHSGPRILGNRRSAPSGPTELTPVGARVFFGADDAAHGRELWVSDGTRTGTHLVKDINPGPGWSVGDHLINFNGTLVFSADDAHGWGLWRSNGTRQGTFLLKTMYPMDMAVAGGKLFLGAAGPIHGAELWVSDGTRAGTHLLRDIWPGPDSSLPGGLTAIGGRVFFGARDAAHGWELWVSDGTEAGTHLVKDIAPGKRSADPSQITDMDGVAYFTARDGVHGCELWRSDGTEAGTSLLKDIIPGPCRPWDSGPTGLANVGGRLYFAADDGVRGEEPWTSDGTGPGTMMVKDVFPGKGASHPRSFADLLGRAYFTACTYRHGCELWTTDGTGPGTSLVKDVRPGKGSSYPSDPTAVGEDLYFFADDGVHGPELWRSDRSGAGTHLVRDVRPGGWGQSWWPPLWITGVGHKVYFAADDGVHGSELWKSNGTRTGTRIVRDINKASTICPSSAPTLTPGPVPTTCATETVRPTGTGSPTPSHT